MLNLNPYATFVTSNAHRDLFFKNNLIEEWARIYPMIFDAHDLQIALNQKHLGYHYYEWFAAVMLYHTEGLFSLVEAYAYKSHERKRKILEKLVSREVLDLVTNTGVSSVTQCPDLFVYSPKGKLWFFSEVKGPRDRLRKSQIELFNKLSQVSGKEVRIVQFTISKSFSPA